MRRDDITDRLPDVGGRISEIVQAAAELGYTDLLINQTDGRYRVKGYYRLHGVDRWRESIIRRYGSLEAYRQAQRLNGKQGGRPRKET